MATDTERERRFWDRYIRLLNDQGIGPPYDRWHVIWAERYIRAFPELRLAAHTAETVTSFLESLGQRATLKDSPQGKVATKAAVYDWKGPTKGPFAIGEGPGMRARSVWFSNDVPSRPRASALTPTPLPQGEGLKGIAQGERGLCMTLLSSLVAGSVVTRCRRQEPGMKRCGSPTK